MWGYILLGVATLFGLWQIYVLVSGRAKFGGYTTPIILLVVCAGLAYAGWKMEASAAPEIPAMMGGFMRRLRY